MEIHERSISGRRWTPRIRRVVVSIGLISISVFGVGPVIASAARLRARSSTTTTTWTRPPDSRFCDAAAKWVGDYSLKIELKLGLNDGGPLPNKMTTSIRETVAAFTNDTSSLAKLAPTQKINSRLMLLAAQLRSSALPINVVRVEAAYGATGFP
jgi:hypothetical protein